MRMHADSRVDIREGIGQDDRLGVARHLASAADGDYLFDTCFARSCDDGLAFTGVFLPLDMGVAIDQHVRGTEKLFLAFGLNPRKENLRRVDFVARLKALTPRRARRFLPFRKSKQGT